MRRLRAWLWVTCVAALLLAAAVQAQGSNVYVVQAGDNLYRIAVRFGTTVDAIVFANNLSDADSIYVGQQLTLPGVANVPVPTPVPSGGTYVVRRGDTLSAIAVRNGVSLWAILQANGFSSAHWIYAGQRLIIPGAGGTAPPATPQTGQTYVVRPGDTLGRIAQQFNTTTFALVRLNNLENPSLIFVGQVLKISGEAPPPPSGAGKRILIDLSQQHLYAYQGEQLVFSFVCSSGVAPYYTRTGVFAVQSKIPNAYGATWGIWMPHWLGIYWAGGTENGIHALPIMQDGRVLWAGYLGSPVSYGCIVLGTSNAESLYNWAEIGTPVTIRQ